MVSVVYGYAHLPVKQKVRVRLPSGTLSFREITVQGAIPKIERKSRNLDRTNRALTDRIGYHGRETPSVRARRLNGPGRNERQIHWHDPPPPNHRPLSGWAAGLLDRVRSQRAIGGSRNKEPPECADSLDRFY